MSRKRGRITVQSQPTGAERGMMKGMGVLHAGMGAVFVVVSLVEIIPHAGLFGLPFLLGGAFFFANGLRMVISKNDISHRVGYDVETDLESSIVGILEDVPENAADGQHVGITEQRLLELQRLYELDLISRGEYEEKRKDILNEL